MLLYKHLLGFVAPDADIEATGLGIVGADALHVVEYSGGIAVDCHIFNAEHYLSLLGGDVIYQPVGCLLGTAHIVDYLYADGLGVGGELLEVYISLIAALAEEIVVIEIKRHQSHVLVNPFVLLSGERVGLAVDIHAEEQLCVNELFAVDIFIIRSKYELSFAGALTIAEERGSGGKLPGSRWMLSYC